MVVAAQYVRMSTEHQHYSIENQMAAIAEYAQRKGFQIAATYADSAKSGIDLRHRPGLRKLLEDVMAETRGFDAILVYDVSRWGRFQDADESAYYEFLCKRAGVQVRYCAEVFDSNDAGITSALLKAVKRAMAAEYLRELSVKVHAGQLRIAEKGFKLGGRAPFGLRRVLLDVNGHPKRILRDGERKSLTTERVTYTTGVEDEIKAVRLIYSLFLEEDMTAPKIARVLNERCITHGNLIGWNHQAVRRILTDPKYAGAAVYNRRTQKLRSPTRKNPRELWVVCKDSFPAIISQEVFDRAQAKWARLVNRRSDERLLSELRELIQTHGKVTPQLLGSTTGTAGTSTYISRFGSLLTAYEMVGFTPPRARNEVELRRNLITLRRAFVADFKRILTEARLAFVSEKLWFQVQGYGDVALSVARCLPQMRGDFRWLASTPSNWNQRPLLVARLTPKNLAVNDYVLLPTTPKRFNRFRINESAVAAKGLVYNSLAEVALQLTVKRAARNE